MIKVNYNQSILNLQTDSLFLLSIRGDEIDRSSVKSEKNL